MTSQVEQHQQQSPARIPEEGEEGRQVCWFFDSGNCADGGEPAAFVELPESPDEGTAVCRTHRAGRKVIVDMDGLGN